MLQPVFPVQHQQRPFHTAVTLTLLSLSLLLSPASTGAARFSKEPHLSHDSAASPALASSTYLSPNETLSVPEIQQMFPPATYLTEEERPGSANCSTFWFEQQLDHFSWRPGPKGQTTYRQRYLYYGAYWDRGEKLASGPIFFYAGNEGNVEGYANYTGLMWELAPKFGALIIFAEHRYYGQSKPFGPDSLKLDPSYLSSEQALADYVVLIAHLKSSLGAFGSPVVAFGGSYGGKLAAWLRMKHPQAVAGAIAASAPVGAFVSPFNSRRFEPERFWEVVTYVASEEAGAAPGCVNNTRNTFRLLFELGRDRNGRADLADAFRLCKPLRSNDDVTQLAHWIQGAFDSFAMGNYPYPSAYIIGGAVPLPAWPMRVVCDHLRGSFHDDIEQLEAMREAVAVMYNASGDADCFQLELSGPAGGPGIATWLYQFCTEMMAQEQPFFPADGVHDMFWDQGPFNITAISVWCRENYGVTPRQNWVVINYGGFDVSGASNIVFTNGGYDPWHVGGILQNRSESVVAVWLPDGAHHADLMFSHPDDPPSFAAARQVETQHIARWVRKYYAAQLEPTEAAV